MVEQKGLNEREEGVHYHLSQSTERATVSPAVHCHAVTLQLII